MKDPIPGSKEAIEKEAGRQHSAAALYDPALPLPSAIDKEKCVLGALFTAPDFGIVTVGSRVWPEHQDVKFSEQTDPNDTTEEQLSRENGLKRSLLERLRACILTEGEDWENQPKVGVVYTATGLEKVRRALGDSVKLKKNGPPPAGAGGDGAGGPAEALYTLLVLGYMFNGRCCRAQIEGRTEPHRAFVKPTHRLGATTLSAGLRLEGCTAVNAELFEYHGPVPVRRGHPLPNVKKEGGAGP